MGISQAGGRDGSTKRGGPDAGLAREAAAEEIKELMDRERAIVSVLIE